VSAGETRVNRSVNTDAEGKYELADLPAGRYNIFVTRNGFVSLQFGQRRPFESGRPLDVGEAQTVEKIDFALPRGGVIAGRITDELGEPLAGVRMQAMRHQYLPNGQRQLAPVMTVMFGGTVSNDLGEFRLFGLMPGAYIVSATPSEVGGTMTMPGAAPSPSDSDGHGITYYPGTINADQAQPITVALSEEAAVSFALVPSRMTRVSGIVRDSQGQPLPGVMLTIRSKIGYGMSMRGLPAVGSDGRFTISNIPPGEHWLEVMQRSDGGEAASVLDYGRRSRYHRSGHHHGSRRHVPRERDVRKRRRQV
jgi:protocatechuate 3,4-dioxygenase beta subunit